MWEAAGLQEKECLWAELEPDVLVTDLLFESAGAKAYVMKQSSPDELLLALAEATEKKVT